MKGRVFGTFVLFLVLMFMWSNAAQAEWRKYVSPDKSFSFHYPQGWSVNQKESWIDISNSRSDESVLVIVLPPDEKKSARDLANKTIRTLKKSNPALRAFNGKEQQDGNREVFTFNLRNVDKEKQYRGYGIVTKNGKSILWLSFTGPAEGYSQKHAAAVLKGIGSSLASGTNSHLPQLGTTRAPSDQRTHDESPALTNKNSSGTPAKSSGLIGMWSSNPDTYGDLVDPSSGTTKGVSYNVEQYKFEPNGTYRMIHCGSGTVISGCATQKGRYEVRGRKLYLHDRKEDWLPDPTRRGQKGAYKNKPTGDEEIDFRFSDQNTLRILGTSLKRVQ